jgi:peptide/nickel transport system permease protein
MEQQFPVLLGRNSSLPSFRKLSSSILAARIPLLAALFLIALCIAALFPAVITRLDPNAIDLGQNLLPPFYLKGGDTLHILGTDQLGRDIFARIVYGCRVSLGVGAASLFISGIAGVLLGLFAGYSGSWVDEIIMRVADIQLAFPSLLLAIAIVAVLGPSVVTVIAVLSLSRWTVYARTVRGQVLSVREEEYVLAARSIGASNRRIMFRHILINIIQPIIVVATFTLANNIVTEASLSFLGLGVPLSTPTWGGMISDGRQYIASGVWWVATFPGIALALTVLSSNLLGDWLRDHLDPQLKRSG